MIIPILRLLLNPIEVFDVEFSYDGLVLVDKLVICNALSFFIFWNCCNCSIFLFFFVNPLMTRKKIKGPSAAQHGPHHVLAGPTPRLHDKIIVELGTTWAAFSRQQGMIDISNAENHASRWLKTRAFEK